MAVIMDEILTPDTRNEIVRDLVTHMYGYMEKPTYGFCKFVAQRLTNQYPFMRDSKGTGHVCTRFLVSVCIPFHCVGFLGKKDDRKSEQCPQKTQIRRRW